MVKPRIRHVFTIATHLPNGALHFGLDFPTLVEAKAELISLTGALDTFILPRYIKEGQEDNK